MRFTCAGGAVAECRIAPLGRADDGQSGGGEPRPSRGGNCWPGFLRTPTCPSKRSPGKSPLSVPTTRLARWRM